MTAELGEGVGVTMYLHEGGEWKQCGTGVLKVWKEEGWWKIGVATE